MEEESRSPIATRLISHKRSRQDFEKEILNQTTTKTSGYLADTKVSLARWFCDRLLRIKPNQSQQTPLPTSSVAPTLVDQLLETNAIAVEEQMLENFINQTMEDGRISVGIVGTSEVGKSMIINALLETTCISEEEYSQREKHTSPKPEGVVLNLSHDSRFEQSIDWMKEKERDATMKEYCFTKLIPPVNEKPFVVPHGSSESRFNDTTFSFRYGDIPEVVVNFRQESEFSNPAYVNNSIKPLLGKKLRFVGTGKDLNLDRIYIREKLQELRTKYGAYTDSFTIRMPCEILRGNREFIEVSGLHNSQIEQSVSLHTNFLLVVVDERGLTHDVRSYLTASGYLKRLIRNPKEFKVSFLVNRRRQVQGQSSTSFSNDMLRQQFTELLREQGLPIYSAVIGNIASTSQIIDVEPLLYTSLYLYNKQTSSQQDLLEKQGCTGFPAFVAGIHNFSLGKCAESIKSINDECMSQIQSNSLADEARKERLQLLSKSSPVPAEKPRETPEEMLSKAFQQQFEAVKKDLISSAQFIDNNLLKKAQEAFQHATLNWVDFKDKYMQSSESCRILLDPRYKGECLGASVNVLTCGSLMASAPAYWKQTVLSRVPQRMEQIIKTSSNLLRECVSLVGCPKDPSTVEKVRLKRLMEFCQMVHKRTTSRVSEITQSLLNQDPETLVKQACEEAVARKILQKSSGINSVKKFHELMQDALPDVPVEAAQNIKNKFEHMLGSSLEQLSVIEKDLHRSAQLVLLTLQSKPDDLKKPEHQAILGRKLAELDRKRKYTSFDNRLMEFAEQATASEDLDSGSTSQSGRSSSEQMQLYTRDARNSSKPVVIETWAVVSGICTRFDVSNLPPLFSRREWSLNPSAVDSEDNQRFMSQLGMAGLTIHDVAADENSQFRALAHQVYGTDTVYAIVRLLVMYEILSNPADYYRYLAQKMDIQEYVARMSNSKEWGDHVTLCAFANFYEADLLIYAPVFSNPLLIKSRNKNASQVYTLAYVKGNHYQSLMSKSLQYSHQQRLDSLEPRTKRMKLDTLTTPRLSLSSSGLCSPGSPISAMETDLDLDDGDEVMSYEPVSQPVLRTTKGGVRPLSQLCLDTIVMNIHMLPPLANSVPEELVQALLNRLIVLHKVSELILQRLMDGGNMQSLDLSYCKQITYASCVVIAGLASELRHLKLAHCVNISTEGMVQLVRNCSNLITLDMEGCYRVDASAISFAATQCKSLQEVNLNGCVLADTGSVSTLFNSCQDLRVLKMRDCSLVSDEAFVDLPASVEELDLTDCSHLSDAAVVEVARKSADKLRSLKVSGKNITDSSIKQLALSCPRLQYLELSNCPVTDDSISFLGQQCPQLKQLKLAFCKNITSNAFRKDGGASVSNGSEKLFPSLCELDLTRCLNVNDDTVDAIIHSTSSLRDINLSSCEDVTDSAIIRLVNHCAESLEHVNLSKCTRISDRAIIHLAQKCPNIRSLSLYNCTLITDASIKALSSRCSSLESLNVSSCSKISDESLQSLAEHCTKMESLCIEESKITDNGLLPVLQACPLLHTVKLSYCKGITDASLNKMSQCTPNLRVLDLSYCSGITLASLCQALPSWPALFELNLRGLQGITIDGLEHPNIAVLNLSWCKDLEDVAVMQIAKGCPSLVDLDLSWCGKLTATAVYQLAQECGALRSLNLRGCTNVPFLAKEVLSGSNITAHS